jgi:hypothetical protein
MHKRLHIQNLIHELRAIRRQPALAIGGNDPFHAMIFLYGFAKACETLGLSQQHETFRQQIAMERGLLQQPGVIMVALKQQGLTDAAVIDALFEIEIEAWERELGYAPDTETL